MRPPQDTARLLEVLHDAGLPVVIVGGVAAVAHGSTMTTRDLDVAMEFSAENPMRCSHRSLLTGRTTRPGRISASSRERPA
jgi:hypothetical protein